MSNILMTVEEINQLKPLEIVTNEKVRTKWTQVYDTLWGAGTGEAAYERESIYFNNKLRDEEKLQSATKFSIFTCFLDLAVCGLSLEPGSRALCYLQGRNFCIGQDASGKKVYEGRLALTVSGYGELVMRARAGQIRHADNPVLVYEEDEFSFGDMNGQKVVNYMCHFPHKTNHIVAAFLRITRADGSVDYAVMLEEDWHRLKSYSEKQNRRWNPSTRQYEASANELYSSNGGGIDTGFLAAKLIKHAFKTYPKVRLGKGTEFESQQEDTKQQEIDDFYGIAPQPTIIPSNPVPPFVEQPVTTQVVPEPTTRINTAAVEEEDDGAF